MKMLRNITQKHTHTKKTVLLLIYEPLHLSQGTYLYVETQIFIHSIYYALRTTQRDRLIVQIKMVIKISLK